MPVRISKVLKEDEEIVRNWLEASVLRASMLLGFLAFFALLGLIFLFA